MRIRRRVGCAPPIAQDPSFPSSALRSPPAPPRSFSCACFAFRGRRRSTGGTAGVGGGSDDVRGGGLRPRPGVRRRELPVFAPSAGAIGSPLVSLPYSSPSSRLTWSGLPIGSEVLLDPPDASWETLDGSTGVLEEEAEERDKGTGNENRGGEDDGGSEDKHGRRPVHVVPSTPAAPKREDEEEPAEVEEKNGEDSRWVREDVEKTAAAPMCKKGTGKDGTARGRRSAATRSTRRQHHLDKLRSYCSSYSQAKKKQKKKPKSGPAPASEKSTAAGVVHRQGASQQKQENKRRVEERALSTVPGVSDSFYYYSGFGPQRGKRSSRSEAADTKVHDGGVSQEAQLPPAHGHRRRHCCRWRRRRRRG